MCQPISFVVTPSGKVFLFNLEERIGIAKGNPKNQLARERYEADSHASICGCYGLDEDKVYKFELDVFEEPEKWEPVFDVPPIWSSSAITNVPESIMNVANAFAREDLLPMFGGDVDTLRASILLNPRKTDFVLEKLFVHRGKMPEGYAKKLVARALELKGGEPETVDVGYTKFKVGDVVRIKSVETLQEEFTPRVQESSMYIDLWKDRVMCAFTMEMAKFCGKQALIAGFKKERWATSVGKKGGYATIVRLIFVDNSSYDRYAFSTDMIEHVEEPTTGLENHTCAFDEGGVQ